MEIEGIINHSLAAALVERDYIAKKVQENKEHINFWNNIKQLHANDEVRNSLEEVSHIRQILGSESYMQYLIEQMPDDPLYYKGFPLKTIEFYLHLRDSLNNSDSDVS